MEPTLTNFEKFHPPQKQNPPPRLLISLLKCLILLQNLMTIFLTIILSYKTLFYHKNWCLLPPPHLVIFHFWHPSTFIPGSTFIREMRVLKYYSPKANTKALMVSSFSSVWRFWKSSRNWGNQDSRKFVIFAKNWVIQNSPVLVTCNSSFLVLLQLVTSG